MYGNIYGASSSTRAWAAEEWNASPGTAPGASSLPLG